MDTLLRLSKEVRRMVLLQGVPVKEVLAQAPTRFEPLSFHEVATAEVLRCKEVLWSAQALAVLPAKPLEFWLWNLRELAAWWMRPNGKSPRGRVLECFNPIKPEDLTWFRPTYTASRYLRARNLVRLMLTAALLAKSERPCSYWEVAPGTAVLHVEGASGLKLGIAGKEMMGVGIQNPWLSHQRKPLENLYLDLQNSDGWRRVATFLRLAGAPEEYVAACRVLSHSGISASLPYFLDSPTTTKERGEACNSI